MKITRTACKNKRTGFRLITKGGAILLWKVLFSFFLMSNQVFAQSTDKKSLSEITGRVLDSLNAEAMEYVTVGLLTSPDKKTVNGVTTDEKGNFQFKEVPEGDFTLTFFYIGYESYTTKKLTVSAGSKTKLPDIKLRSKQTQLQEVTVSTERALIENKIDKLVYNADRDMTTQGGTASDVLSRIPQVSVDINGNVEVQGTGNIRFLINGKPSSMFGSNVADVLRTIPANQIQSVEVVTNPGAKYDAEGGSIINIILKKSESKGYSGALALTVGTRLENGSVNVSAKNNDFGMNAFVSGNAQLPSITLNNLHRTSKDSIGNSTSLSQDGTSTFMRNGLLAGLSGDWTLNSKNSLNVACNANQFYSSTKGSLSRNINALDNNGQLVSDQASVLQSDNISQVNALDWSLNYKRTYNKEGKELEVLYSSSFTKNDASYSQAQFLNGNALQSLGAKGQNPGKDFISNLSLNFAQPISKSVIIEMGAKAVNNTVKAQSNIYIFSANDYDFHQNNSQSSDLTYHRNIGAAYLSGTFKLPKGFDLKVGARYEYTQTDLSFSSIQGVNIKPYSTLIPSAAISKNLKKNQSIKLNYSKRISRPSYRDLNPFINATDPKNLSTGNPALNPEFSHNAELTYSRFFEKGSSFSASGYFRGNFQDIQPYSTYYSDFQVGDSVYSDVTVSRRANIGTEYNIGCNLFVNLRISKILSIRSNASLYQRYIYSVYKDGDIQGFMYRINATASLQFSEFWSAEMYGNFNSPRINVQGVQPSFTTYNIAIRKLSKNKKASLALTAINPFAKYVNQKTEVNGSNFNSYSVVQLPYRSFGINFTYKFGKLEFKKQKQLDDQNLTNPTSPVN